MGKMGRVALVVFVVFLPKFGFDFGLTLLRVSAVLFSSWVPWSAYADCNVQP